MLIQDYKIKEKISKNTMDKIYKKILEKIILTLKAILIKQRSMILNLKSMIYWVSDINTILILI
jgi:hypothetical protein